MDKVIEILEDLICNFTLHEEKREEYVKASAQAIDDLYKGDENGLLSLEQVVKIYADAHWGSDIPDFNKVTDSLNEHFQVQRALDKKKEQERVERILKKIESNRFGEPQHIAESGREPVTICLTVSEWQRLKQQEGL